MYRYIKSDTNINDFDHVVDLRKMEDKISKRSKIYQVIEDQFGQSTLVIGTMRQLAKYYEVTLRNVYHYDPSRFTMNPKTAKQLQDALDFCIENDIGLHPDYAKVSEYKESDNEY